MKSKFAELVNYFERLAACHVKIKHSDQEKHFFRFEMEEMLTGMRSNVNYPAIILEGYDFNFIDGDSDNVHKKINCAFMIIGKVSDKGDFDAIHDLWDQLEEIGDEIIIRILSDKRERTENCLDYFHAKSVSGAPLADVNLIHYGFRYEFQLSWAIANDINPGAWESA